MRLRPEIKKLFIYNAMLIFVICIMPRTFSKYETNMNSTADIQTAFYVLKTDYQYQTIKLPDIIPSDDPYVYTFSVSNNKDGNRLETRLAYNLSIRTTTNLPLTYELYKNATDLTTATSIKTDDEVREDEYGTYFRYITTNTDYFSYLYDETNTYTLVINFPKKYNDYTYQGLVEFIEITFDSRQLTDND